MAWKLIHIQRDVVHELCVLHPRCRGRKPCMSKGVGYFRKIKGKNYNKINESRWLLFSHKLLLVIFICDFFMGGKKQIKN